MNLLQKEKTFLCIFEIYIQFWSFTKKDDPHILCISEIRDPESRG